MSVEVDTSISTVFLVTDPESVFIFSFGSVPVKDPEGMTRTIFDAVRTSNVRALVSAGWGGLGGEEIPEGVFILGESGSFRGA